MSARETRAILARYRASDEATRTAGAVWYDEAQAYALELSDLSGYSLERVAIAIALLSPRASWQANKAAARALVTGAHKPSGMLARSWLAARNALMVDDPWALFSKRASKTCAFARAILGDSDAVVIDIWAARVAGIDPDTLSRAGVYDEVARSYRNAAARVGITPREMQAITWIQARGKAA